MILVLILWVPILTAIGFLIYGLYIAVSPSFIIYYYFQLVYTFLRIIFPCCRKRNFKNLSDKKMLEEKNIINLQWQKSLFLKQA
jgi:hypothetical protein